ncbi:hypothetical protein XPA_001013 [Xanthoria parietina]
MTFNRGTEQDRRTTSPVLIEQAALAPEVASLGAPEWRGDNAAPEVAVKSAPEVYYDNSLPEAVPLEHHNPKSLGGSTSEDTHASRVDKPHKKSIKSILVATLLLVVIVGIGLGVGLGVGLRRGSRESTTTRIQSPSFPKLPHGMMDDTSLAVVTLPNSDRQIYFQENTGALRRTNYSSQVGLWQTSDVPRLDIPGPRRNTPLAVSYIERSGEGDGTVYLIFVSSANDTLECLSLNVTTNHGGPCSDWSGIQSLAAVSASTQLSAISLTTKSSPFTGLLMVYEDFSNKLAILLYFASRRGDHIWRDETGKFNAALSSNGHAGAQVSTACKAIWVKDSSPTSKIYNMYCFADLDPNETSDNRILAYFQFQVDGSSKFTITYTTTSLSNTFGNAEDFSNTSSELILVPQHSSIEELPMWFKDSTSEVPVGSLPSPSSSFPYHRLASTYADASLDVYLYHQASESLLVEEWWNHTGRIWIARNITIDTSSR